MSYFEVKLAGDHVWLPEERRGWFGLRRRRVEVRCGFVTTRLIETSSPEEAASLAVELVDRELLELSVNRKGESFGIRVEGISEQKYITPEWMPGGGFTFYAQTGLGTVRPARS